MGISEKGGAQSGALSVKTDPETPESTPADDTRLAVIADLLADLPSAERRDVITDLSPADRAAVARLLITRTATDNTEKQ